MLRDSSTDFALISNIILLGFYKCIFTSQKYQSDQTKNLTDIYYAILLIINHFYLP